MINLFGNGYVGKEFSKRYNCIIQDRNDLVPKTSDQILYMISTIDNYHVKVNPYLDIETNLTTLVRVLENLRLTNNKATFNFVSSWFVYGDTNLPAKETSYCNPKGFYSITKRAAEQLLVSYCETYNLNYRILRFANVIGGTDHKASKKKNALTFLLNELKNHREINLYDSGDFYRDYIYVGDLCSAVNLVLSRGKPNETYNICNGIPIKFSDIIFYAANKLDRTHLIKNIEQAEFHKIVQVKSMYMDNTKLNALGYRPEKTVFDVVDSIIDV